MITRVKALLGKLLGDGRRSDSALLRDRLALDDFVSCPGNTFLVSFPRTGSHWLRMLMELYFGRPSLTRAFYYPDRTDYLTLHTHDLDLKVKRSHVIYLYRDPVDTIYSQMQYHSEDSSNRARIIHWADLYGRHLDKWLHWETFAQWKTVLRYGRLKTHMTEEFPKVCEHFGEELDPQRLTEVANRVTRDQVRERTLHDPKVVNASRAYEDGRVRFRAESCTLVWEALLDGREHLRTDF